MKIENTLVSGKTIKCMERARFNGQMARYMMDNTKMTRNMDLGHLAGRMGGNMSVSGNRENSMVEANTIFQTRVRNWVNGLRVRE